MREEKNTLWNVFYCFRNSLHQDPNFKLKAYPLTEFKQEIFFIEFKHEKITWK